MLKLLKNPLPYQNFLSKFSKKSVKPFSSAPDFRGTNRKPYNMKIGEIIEDFKLEEIKDFSDFSIRSFHLTHQKTGAQFLHFDTSDQNNCFAIIFKTLPGNDKGFQ